MIESFDFLDVVNKSNENKKPNTTSNNLKLFFSQSSKLHSSDSYSTKDEDDYDINIANDFLDIANYSGIENLNPSLPLKEEVETEENFSLYFNSVKENNQNSSFLGQKRKLFKINYRKKYDESNEISPSLVEKAFLNNKVLPTIKRRRENQDNIRKKLKTVFFNTFLRKKINEILNNKHSRLYFEKFPISFVNDIRKNTNKDVIDKTLLEIILNKELYSENDLSNYNHNIKVVENKEVKQIGELKKILNKTFRELFEEFINSKEFNFDEIKKLKSKKDEDYIQNYIYVARHFFDYRNL